MRSFFYNIIYIFFLEIKKCTAMRIFLIMIKEVLIRLDRGRLHTTCQGDRYKKKLHQVLHLANDASLKRVSFSNFFFQKLLKIMFLLIEGGGRTSWEKEYYSSVNPFLKKTDFKRDKKWPTPQDYIKKPGFGDRNQQAWYQYPTYSIPGTRQNTAPEIKDEKQLPNINNNNKPRLKQPIDRAADINENIIEFILKPHKNTRRLHTSGNDHPSFYKENQTKITLKSRPKGTLLWQKPEDTPGPGAHDHTKFTTVKPTKPSFKITNNSYNVNFAGGPYAVI